VEDQRCADQTEGDARRSERHEDRAREDREDRERSSPRHTSRASGHLLALEVVPLPVIDIDRALTFYTDRPGFTLDVNVQLASTGPSPVANRRHVLPVTSNVLMVLE
jgi:hypothetical protein